jgi:hypothetical protein
MVVVIFLTPSGEPARGEIRWAAECRRSSEGRTFAPLARSAPVGECHGHQNGAPNNRGFDDWWGE